MIIRWWLPCRCRILCSNCFQHGIGGPLSEHVTKLICSPPPCSLFDNTSLLLDQAAPPMFSVSPYLVDFVRYDKVHEYSKWAAVFWVFGTRQEKEWYTVVC